MRVPECLPTIVQFCAESLATIPSIVMGLFGLLIFVNVFGWKFTALGGALTLTLLNLPALMRVTQEALSRRSQLVSRRLDGARRNEVADDSRVVLPSAIAQLTTGIVLIAGRIFGETAALDLYGRVSVSAGKSAYDLSPFHEAETLSVHLWYTHSERLVPDANAIGNGSALVLLVMVLFFNIAARFSGRALSKRLTGK